LRIVFDKNVPVGVRRFLQKHEVSTFVQMQWHPQLENGDLLREAESARFDVLITADQNIGYQQNLTGRKLALIVLGSNIWPVVRAHEEAIATCVDTAAPGSYDFLEMPVPPKRGSDGR
jgi:predicted nuclease of predicted toxin-antitoxin system